MICIAPQRVILRMTWIKYRLIKGWDYVMRLIRGWNCMRLMLE